jgi:uncharacterized pyridoxal phosphate-containing UPF0001 family protein
MESTLAARLHELRRRMAAAALADGRSEDSVTLVAVSKGHSPGDACRCAESSTSGKLLQEALPKFAALTDLS